MRLTSGKYGGRVIVAPRTTGTRPMSDKVRQAVFNTLGDLAGLAVLDAFAGSGALAFEAVSRGAVPVTAIENAHLAQRAISQNAKALGLGVEFRLLTASVESYLARNPADRFDLIFADPPYAQLKEDILEKLGGLLSANGTLVVSHSAQYELAVLDGLTRAKRKVYGGTGISLYQPTGQAGRD